MGFFNRVSYAGKKLFNTEPNEEQEIGIGFDDLNKKDSLNIIDVSGFKVARTIKNCRAIANDPTVGGILEDNIVKTVSTFVIKGSDSKATDFIIDMCNSENWDIKQLMTDALYSGKVDGELFVSKTVVENKIIIRDLAFDANNYRIKRKFDEYGKVIGYKQLTKRNKETSNGWLKKKFESFSDILEELVVPFEKGEIINFKYRERKGKGRSTVMRVLDQAMFLREIEAMMPQLVYKNANIMVLTMGNEKKSTVKLSKKHRDFLAQSATDHHKKGFLIVPYGIGVEIIKGDLPNLDNYLKWLEKRIYVGLTTPEATFSGETSNYAAIKTQKDSEKTGQVVTYSYDQEWLKKYIEEELFKPQLELANYSEDVKVWIDFNPSEEDLNAPFLDDKEKKKLENNLEDNNSDEEEESEKELEKGDNNGE